MADLGVCLLGRYCLGRLDGLMNVPFHSTCSCPECNWLYRNYACFVCIMFMLCVVFIPAVMMSRRSHQTLLHICMMKRPWKASGYHR